MKEIREKLNNIDTCCIEDGGAKEAIRQLLEINILLVAMVEQIPDWVLEYRCCPPGNPCSMCD